MPSLAAAPSSAEVSQIIGATRFVYFSSQDMMLSVVAVGARPYTPFAMRAFQSTRRATRSRRYSG